MASYASDSDSDTSLTDYTSTPVTLAYALPSTSTSTSTEEKGKADSDTDALTHLGGTPVWLPSSAPPKQSLRCKKCGNLLVLLLQLQADLPEVFAGHERAIWVFACRKGCREGGVRALRARRLWGNATSETVVKGNGKGSKAAEGGEKEESKEEASKDKKGLGEALFGVKMGSSSTTQINPFASPSAASASINPFSTTSSLAAKPAQPPSANPASTSDTTQTASFAQTFAEKVRISSPSTQPATPSTPTEPWPTDLSAFPAPYALHDLDAEREYLEPDTSNQQTRVASNTLMDDNTSGSGADMKDAFESSMDKTFQRFADRLAQNPEQVMRYEHGGQPLLYSKTDKVGKLLSPAQDAAASSSRVAVQTTSGMPRCTNCGAKRVFEMQLVPHAITMLEAEEEGLGGMDWGTVIVGTCERDCGESGVGKGEVSYVEEWVAVQWEEIVKKR